MVSNVIRPIPTVTVVTDHGIMTYKRNYGQPITIASYAWYIEGPKSNILVDTGSTVDAWMNYGGHKATSIQSIEDGLGKLGLKPEDIDTVILTHLHFDHAELSHKYTKAQFIVQKAELAMANNPHPVLTSFYNDWSRSLWEGVNIRVVEGDEEVADGVKVMLTPGHAMGGQSVAIETSAGTAIIAGICCTMENFEADPIIPTGSHYNLPRVYDSMMKVKNMADIIVAMHDTRFITQDRIPN